MGAIYAPSQMGTLALVSALLSVFLVYAVSRVDGHVPVDTLLLAGIAYGFLASAVTWYLVLSQGERAHVTWMWLMGSFNGADWRDVGEMFFVSLLGIGFLVWKWRELNLILFGEESIALGLDVHFYRKLFIGGHGPPDGLRGLDVGHNRLRWPREPPHVVRLILGPNHRNLTPASALFGGSLLVLADLIARTAARPTEIPVGIVTALMGGAILPLPPREAQEGGELYS